jgi:cytoskeleton protein RodZ
VTATQQQRPADVDGLAPASASAGPGARLRAAREAAGLSLDQVAHQLKLAPRQVRALEEESFGELPGRTFSRGFVRNYARLLHLDAQDLLAHLPDAAQAPALGSPTLHSTGTMMAELPSAGAPKPGLGRWLIPLILIGCIVAAAAYEWYRGGLTNNAEPARSLPDTTDRRAPAAAAPAMVLPNPLVGSTPTAAPLAEAPQGTPPQGAMSQNAPSAASMRDSVATPVSASTSPSAATDEATVLLTYRGPSWTEIRDRSGQLVIARLVSSDSMEPVTGTPPFDVVLGNARAVTLVFRGKSIDLSPFTRQNVARLTLQ